MKGGLKNSIKKHLLNCLGDYEKQLKMTASEVRPHQERLSVQNYFPHRPFRILVGRRAPNLVQLVLAHTAILKVNFTLLQQHLKCLQGMNSLATWFTVACTVFVASSLALSRKMRRQLIKNGRSFLASSSTSHLPPHVPPSKLCARDNRRARRRRFRSTYIIIKEIEINISCKLISQNPQLTFDALRLAKHFVLVFLGGRLRKPLAYVRTHPFTQIFALLPHFPQIFRQFFAARFEPGS